MTRIKTLQSLKKHIRAYLRDGYKTIEQLCAGLAHAQDGKLVYKSCCCFIGIPTADHELQTKLPKTRLSLHYNTAREHPLAASAEAAYATLGHIANAGIDFDELRRKRIIPMYKAEIRRRMRLLPPAEPTRELVYMSRDGKYHRYAVVE